MCPSVRAGVCSRSALLNGQQDMACSLGTCTAWLQGLNIDGALVSKSTGSACTQLIVNSERSPAHGARWRWSKRHKNGLEPGRSQELAPALGHCQAP